MQTVEEQLLKLITLLKEKGYDSSNIINELIDEVHIKKEIPISN